MPSPGTAGLTEVLWDVHVVPEPQAGVGSSRQVLALQPGSGAPRAQHAGVEVHIVTWTRWNRAQGIPLSCASPPCPAPPQNAQTMPGGFHPSALLPTAAFGTEPSLPGEAGKGMLWSQGPWDALGGGDIHG